MLGTISFRSKLCLVMFVPLLAATGDPHRSADGAAQQRWCDQLPRPQYAALERAPSADDWFEVYHVADGVYAIYEPFQFQEVISYLIVGSWRALLFDTGMGIGRISDVVRELTELPIRVLNSHTHFDHVGGNAEFDDILGLDMPDTRRRAEGSPNHEVRGEVAPAALCRPLPAGVSADSYSIRPFEIGGFIDDGDVIELGDRRLQVLTIPGHTPDSIMLLDAANGLLWTGDTFYEGPIWLIAAETDLEAYEASLERMAALASTLRMVLPGHNTPVAEPGQLVAALAAFREIRAGEREPDETDGGRLLFRYDRFSFLIGAEHIR